MTTLARFIIRNSTVVLILTALVTLFAVSRIVDFQTGEVHLELDPSVNRLLPEHDEERAYYDRVRTIFGSDDTLLIGLVADDAFAPEVLESVVRITERVEQIPGVHHVVSLSTALNIRSEGEDLEIEPFLTGVPETEAERARVRAEALENPIYSGNLVSRDGRATALFVYFLDMTEREFRRAGLDDQIAAISAEEAAGVAEIYLTGPPHINVATSLTLISDLRRTLPLILLGTALVALFAFRTLRGVLVPLTSVGLAVVWTMGAVAWMRNPLNIVTTIVPPLILAVGFAYTVHVVSAYYDAVREGTSEDPPMEAGLRHVALAVLLTGLTTLIGFLSLMVSPLVAIRDFALYSVIGIGSTLVISMTFAPAVLHLLPLPKRKLKTDDAGLAGRVAERLGRFNLANRNAILVGGGVLGLASVVGMAQLEVTSDMVGNFPAQHPVRLDFDAVNSHFGGANPFYIVLETEYSDAFTDPLNLRHMRALQEWLEAQPEIGNTTSVADYVRLINRGFHENDPAQLVIPGDQELISQLLMFGANDEIKNFVDSRYQTATILVRSKVIDSAPLGDLLDRIEVRLADLPEHLHARITGTSVLVTRTLDAIARGQVESLATAFGVIYLVLVVLFTSFRVGFIAMIPNVLPVAAFFGIMGFADITLSTVTSLVACIVLGIAVDDSIHYLARFNEDSRRLASEDQGTVAALRSLLRPVTITTAACCVGFGLLTLSDLRTFVHFGGLAAAALAVAWLIDLTLTPALCSRLRVVSLYDVLTLDLGPDPQEAIPLFRGLSRTQARIVALTASIRSFPAGQRVLQSGDTGDEMYVVIDGELDATAPHEDGPVHLGRLGRGDPLGEVALFHRGKRTADVDAVTDVRLLRLTSESLDRLARRYPRTALKVSRNLNNALAERLEARTARIR